MSLVRYGLVKHPFGDDLANFLICPNLLPFYVEVEGFAEQKPRIDNWAGSQITRSQFFLIYGYSGTGRTSVSNYIAEKFPVPQNGNLLKVSIKVPDADHFGALHKWMREFGFKAKQSKILFPPTFNTSFEAEIKNRQEPHSDETAYKSLLFDALAELKANNKRLVAIFENVQNPLMFTFAQAVFDPPGDPPPDIVLVIFTTSAADYRNEFQKLNPKPSGLPPIELRPLSGPDVLEFISQRWKQVEAPLPHPFDGQAVVEAFNVAKYPVGRVVKALEYILDMKIENLKPGESCWPHDESLRVNEADIYRYLYRFDKTTPQ